MAKGQLRFTPFVLIWQTTSRETIRNDGCRILMDKISRISEILTRTEVPDIIIIVVHVNYAGQK